MKLRRAITNDKKIATCNMRNKSNKEEVEKELHEANISETKLKGTKRIENYLMIYSGVQKNSYSEVNSQYDKKIQTCQ